jgi:hypothetical protein
VVLAWPLSSIDSFSVLITAELLFGNSHRGNSN